MVSVGENKNLAKKLELNDIGGKKKGVHGIFEKHEHISGALERHAHIQGTVHTQERPEYTLIIHLWLNLRT